jgi:thymidylate synthase (FAD)
MQVDLIDWMGSDLSVVNAARVSFANQHSELDEKSDSRLISFLAKHGHWSPFAHSSMQFRIKAPVFVARQLVKHQVGLSWNEISRRYVDFEVEFYEPEVWRGKAADKKQGSSDEEIDINPHNGMVNDYQLATQQAKWTYEELLRKGVAPEQARMVLPQSMMTEWYWSGTLYAFARVCALRLHETAQEETRIIAKQISQHARKLFPVCWDSLTEEI